MKSFRTFLMLLTLVIITGSVLFLRYYSFVFAREIQGELVAIDIPKESDAMQESFLFMIAIRTTQGDIFVATSEDRQWKVAQKGQCVVAKYFPYPPWQMDKFGSYHGAKLLKLFDCALQNPGI